jgi:hypothetical protein
MGNPEEPPKARALSEVADLQTKKNIPDLSAHAATGRMQENEIKDDLIARIPQLGRLFDSRDNHPPCRFE